MDLKFWKPARKNKLWKLAYDAAPNNLVEDVHQDVADMAVEVATIISKRHDLGKDALPSLARHHGQQIGELVEYLSNSNDPKLMEESKKTYSSKLMSYKLRNYLIHLHGKMILATGVLSVCSVTTTLSIFDFAAAYNGTSILHPALSILCITTSIFLAIIAIFAIAFYSGYMREALRNG